MKQRFEIIIESATKECWTEEELLSILNEDGYIVDKVTEVIADAISD